MWGSVMRSAVSISGKDRSRSRARASWVASPLIGQVRIVLRSCVLSAVGLPLVAMRPAILRRPRVGSLHTYQFRGVIPRNTDFPDRDVPVFIDWRGTRCGFAYLVEQTGHEDLVLRIAATRNYARVPELRDDPAVGRWLAQNGITLAEATRIQPTYGCGSPRGACAVAGAVPPASDGYKVATGVSVATNVATFTLNVLNTGISRQAGGIASVGAGTIGIVAGASNLGTSGPRGTLGLLNTGIGAASLALGVLRLSRTGHAGTPSALSLAPGFGTRGSTGRAGRVAV